MTNQKLDIKKINQSIISSKDVPSSVDKTPQFYQYLLNNDVGYYYSQCLSRKPTGMEKRVLKKGGRFNERYQRTLELLCDVCNQHKIEFLLFKTHKYIPEVVAGDIDIIVRSKDFHRFLDIFGKLGFSCKEDEVLKGGCKKGGFCKIEPRVNISAHNIILMREDEVWKHIETVGIGNREVQKTTKELDLFNLLLNILYGPNYLKLYLYIVLQQADKARIMAVCPTPDIKRDLEFLLGKISAIDPSRTPFPYFLDNLSFIRFYVRRIAFGNSMSLVERVKHIVFFFYIKYKYQFIGGLHFKHEWF